MNNDAALDVARVELQMLYSNISPKVENGEYFKPGGYEEYSKDLDEIQELYKSITANNFQVG